MLVNNALNNINLCSAGVVSSLDLMLRADPMFKIMSIEDIFTLCAARKDVAYILIGLWGYGLMSF